MMNSASSLKASPSVSEESGGGRATGAMVKRLLLVDVRKLPKPIKPLSDRINPLLGMPSLLVNPGRTTLAVSRFSMA